MHVGASQPILTIRRYERKPSNGVMILSQLQSYTIETPLFKKKNGHTSIVFFSTVLFTLDGKRSFVIESGSLVSPVFSLWLFPVMLRQDLMNKVLKMLRAYSMGLN